MSLLTDSEIAEIEARVAAKFRPKIEFVTAELETCRRKFEKGYEQTFVEFAKQTVVYFDSRCSTAKDDPNYEQRKHMFLIKRFKICVNHRFNLKMYLDEQNVETLHEMAVLADDYALTHKRSLKPRQGGHSKSDSDSCGFGVSGSVQTPTGVSSGSNAGSKPDCDSHSSGTSGSSYSSCGGESLKASPEVKPAGFVSSVKPVDRTPIVEEITDHVDPKFDGKDEYRPSVSVGSVSPVDSVSTSVPVKILCDTRATQTLESKHTLHFDTSSATGESVQTIQTSGPAESGWVGVPLHHVNLVSDIVSGSDVVGVMNTRPVNGVSIISVKDVAGGKVIAEPKVVMEPVTSAETDKFEEEVPSVIPLCVVTQARASKMAEDTRALIKMGDKQNKDGDPSVNISDKDQDPSVKIEDQSVMDQDPSISIGRNRDKDQDGGPNKGKLRLRSDADWHDGKTTKMELLRRNDSDHQDDHRDEDRWRRGTPDDEPRDDVGRRQNDACDDRGPRSDFCDDDRGSRRNSDNHHVPLSISDQCHRVLCEAEENQEKMRELDERKVEKHQTEVQIEHSRHEVIDGIGGGEHAAHEKRDEPEASDWRHGTTKAMDVDCQKAFDTDHRWIPRTKASDAERWCLLWSASGEMVQ